MERFIIFLIAEIVCGQNISDRKSVHLLQEKKFIQNPWWQPVSDAVSGFINITKHPNYGGVQLLNPLNLWQKLHEKAGSYFTGPHGATFGIAHNGPLDYPFAYRKTKK